MPESIIQFITWTVAGAFAVVVVLTLINIFNIKPLLSYCEAPDSIKDKLFTLLIVEIIAIGITAAGAYIGNKGKIIKEKNKIEDTLKLSLDAWRAASKAWINEPSGLSRSGLESSDELGELLIAVDDEESAVFVLSAGPDRFPLVRSLLSLRDKNNKVAAEDLEAVTYDGEKYYYAIASHRQLGEKGKARRTRKLLKFTIPSNAWETGYLSIVVESSIDLTAPPAGRKGLKEFLDENGIQVEGWSKRGNLPQRYGLEIEGMAYSGGQLYIGLRWPLDLKSALLISYNTKSEEFNWLRRIDLDGQGITALETSGEYLLVASNPPEKADLKNDPSSARFYGNSGLWSFSIAKLASGENTIIKGKRLFLESKPDAKLEGIAVVDSRIFFSFEGEKPYFENAPLPKLN